MHCKKCWKPLTYMDLLFYPYSLCAGCRREG